MANEALFQALAQAEARPSKALRAVQSGAQAVNDTVGGVLQGQQIRQQLDQNRLLNTRLGDMYGDPSQIPFGLGPQHTVKDLMTLAPVMENFIPQSAAQGIVNMYTGQPAQNSSTGNNGGANPTPSTPSGSSAPSNNGAPNGLPASLVRNPPIAQGQANLDAAQGTGAPNPALVPPGQPLKFPPAPTQPLNQAPAPTQVVGNSGSSGVPQVVIPAGGIGKPAMQMLQPALNAAREGQQFQQGQAGENARFNAGQTNENSRFNVGQANESARQATALAQAKALANATHMASVVEKIQPSIDEIGGIKNLISQITPLVSQNTPLPGTGNLQASAANALGGIGTPQMKRSLAINNAGTALSASLDKLVAGRFNENETKLLNTSLVPTGNDQPAYAKNKLQKLNAFVGTLEAGNAQAIRNMGAAITGGQINPTAPSAPAGDGIPMLRVRNKQTGQTGSVPANKFNPNKYDQLNG